MKKIIVFIGILALLSSCASTKQYSAFTHNSSIDNSKGRIYVVRPKGMTGAAVKTKVYCNETLIGTTGNGSYLCFDMLEGTYHIGTTQHTRLYSGAAIGFSGRGRCFCNKSYAGENLLCQTISAFRRLFFRIDELSRREKSRKQKKNTKS